MAVTHDPISTCRRPPQHTQHLSTSSSVRPHDLTSKHITHKHYDQGGHYTLIVVSDDFKNISLLERHKIIYNILNGMLKNEIHALSITAKTIDEYQTKY